MITGADCHFTEIEPGKWRYELQRWPYGETGDYDKYGPFSSYAKAYKHLHENHANPGGHGIRVHEHHVHEWEHTTGGMRVVGFNVEVLVRSLGSDASKEAVIAHVKSLASDHPAWTVSPDTRWDSTYEFVACGACGAKK